MKKTMLFAIIMIVVMAFTGCMNNVENTIPTDEELANTYVVSEFGDEYAYSIYDIDDGDDGFVYMRVYKNGDLKYYASFNREYYTNKYFG